MASVSPEAKPRPYNAQPQGHRPVCRSKCQSPAESGLWTLERSKRQSKSSQLRVFACLSFPCKTSRCPIGRLWLMLVMSSLLPLTQNFVRVARAHICKAVVQTYRHGVWLFDSFVGSHNLHVKFCSFWPFRACCRRVVN